MRRKPFKMGSGDAESRTPAWLQPECKLQPPLPEPLQPEAQRWATAVCPEAPDTDEDASDSYLAHVCSLSHDCRKGLALNTTVPSTQLPLSICRVLTHSAT